jgi:thiol:disulfide interchange protein DsbD
MAHIKALLHRTGAPARARSALPKRVPGLLLRLVAGWLLSLALATAAPAHVLRQDHMEAELISEQLSWAPGERAWVALRLRHEPHWHSYWINPGDAGAATRIQWTLPPGFAAGPIEWPAPRLIPLPPLANYGYEGEVLLLVPIHVPQGAPPGTATLQAHADWLVCNDVCIPGGGDFQLALPMDKGPAAVDLRWADAFAAARAALPRPVAGWQASARGEGGTIDLSLPLNGQPAPAQAYFFCALEGLIETARPQVLSVHDGVLHLQLPVAVQLSADAGRIAGVLQTSPPLVPGVGGLALSAPIAGAIHAGAPAPAAEAGGAETGAADGSAASGPVPLDLALALLAALAGGAILNLMPCVFPVLSIKILGFADRAHGERALLRGQGLAYSAGVILSFVAFALAMVVLRGSSTALGWGFQMQSPAVVMGLAMLFTLLALNLFGLFEILLAVGGGAPGKAPHGPLAAAFGSGLLAAVVASPCTAPFMGAAVGFALTQSAPAVLAIFLALGAGMALPYLLLTLFPGWLRRLPRPGPWLGHLRQLLGFPLLATVLWLLWVLGQQVGSDHAAWAGAALLVLALAAWLWGLAQRGAAAWVRAAAMLGAGLAVLMAAASAQPAQGAAAGLAAPAAEEGWENYSPQALAQHLAGGEPVFVDFTAAWCVTCQVNRRLVLERTDIRQDFAAHAVVRMRADWTRADPVITEALHALARNGVPVYVLYRPGKEPLVLPELLQPGAVRGALARL